jgi:acyl carrier protein
MDDMTTTILDYVRREYIDEDEAGEIVLDPGTRLISGGIVDSFSMVSLKRFLEKQYAIAIPDADATPETFDTVNGIVALVRRLRKEA